MEYLRDLALFVAVADARSFSRAAAALGMPTSTLSRRIGELEAALGFQLFRRSTRSVSLTEAGALYRQRCDGIVEAAEDALEAVRSALGTPRGVLRVSIEAEIGPRLVGPAIAEYLERFPEMRVELDLSPRRVDLIGEGFDVAVRLGKLPDSAVISRRLAWLESGLYASPRYLERAGLPEHARDLETHRRIHLLHKGDRGEWQVTESEHTLTIEADGVAWTNNMAMVRMLARQGVGIAAVDRLMAADDVASGALVPVLPACRLPPYPVSVLTPDKALPARARLFIDLLTQQVAAMAGVLTAGPER